jgi:hypothetical protein
MTSAIEARAASALTFIGAIGPSTPPSSAYPAPHRPPQHPPAWVLAIPLDRQLLALRSTRKSSEKAPGVTG